MERLTYKLGAENPSYGLVDKASAKPGLFTDYDGFYAHLLANHRLGEYEDTGLTPTEVAEYAKAKADGRAVILPCKVGDEIFSLKWSIKSEKYEVHTGKVKNVRYDTSDGIVSVSDGERYCVWGKTVFGTRADAEKALEGMM